MDNRETLQSHNTRLSTNNVSLNGLIDKINSLPEPVNLTDELITYDTELDEQEIMIQDISNALTIKTLGIDMPEKGAIFTEWSSGGYPLSMVCKGIKTIPDDFCKVSSSAPSIIRLLKIITLDDDLTSIGENAFSGLTKLALTKLPETITKIDRYAFNGCTNLALTKLPESLTYMGDYAFYNCANLALTKLPKGLATISSNAFYNTGISIKTIPDNITEIMYSAFDKCSNITQISSNKLVKLVGSANTMGCFTNCTNLIAVWLPDTFTQQGVTYPNGIFYGCTSLKKIFVNRPRAEVETIKGYTYAWQYDANKISMVICNDDEGFITKEEFDAIDWSTYTEEEA